MYYHWLWCVCVHCLQNELHRIEHSDRNSQNSQHRVSAGVKALYVTSESVRKYVLNLACCPTQNWTENKINEQKK